MWSECDGAKGVLDNLANDNLAFVLKTVPNVLAAFRQPFKSYQKEHLVG